MAKRLSYEEKFERFKGLFNTGWVSDFHYFCQLSEKWQDIKKGLVKEKVEQLKDEAGE